MKRLKSLSIPDWVLYHPDLTAADQFVLSLLIARAHKEKALTISHAEIAGLVNLGYGTVREAMGHLAELGYLATERVPGRASTVRLTLPPGRA